VHSMRFLLRTLLVGAALVVAGCTGSDPDIPNGFMNLSGVQTEYDQTVEDFPYPLPDGVTFPAQVQQPDPSGPSVIYQKGSGLVQAYQFWECSWEQVALDSQGNDQDRVNKALDELEQGLNSIYRTQYVEDPDGGWKSTIDKARLGDFGIFSEFYQSDCGWYRMETGQ